MPQTLRNLRVREVSSVDRGAGEGVRIMLMKRDFTADERKRAAAKGHAMPDGSFPIETPEDVKNAVRAIGRASDPAAAKAHVKRRAKALGCEGMLPGDWVGKALDPEVVDLLKEAFGVPDELLLKKSSSEPFVLACDALRKSLDSIVKANSGTIGARDDAFGKTLDQFVTHVAGFAPEIATAMKRGANSMATLKEQLQKAFAASTDAEKDAVRKELEGSVAALETSKTALETGLKKAEAETAVWKKRAEAAFGLEKSARDYLNHPDVGLAGEELFKFLDMSPAERAEFVKANPIEQMTQKRIEALPEPVRKQLAEGQAAAVQVAKMEEEREVEAFSKRAAGYGQPAEFGKHLRTLAKGLGTDEERAAAFDAVTKALEAAVNQAKTAGLFRELGSAHGGAGTAHEELLTKAQELRESVAKAGSGKPLSPDQAFAKVYEDPANRELVARYRTETGSRRTAA